METGSRPQVGEPPTGQGAAHLVREPPGRDADLEQCRNTENKSSRCRGNTEVTEDSGPSSQLGQMEVRTSKVLNHDQMGPSGCHYQGQQDTVLLPWWVHQAFVLMAAPENFSP